MQVNDIEGLPQQHLLDGAVERDVEGQAHARFVARDRDSPPNAIKISPDLEPALSGSWGDDRDLMTEAIELSLEMLNMLGHTAGVREVVRSDLRDFHERELRDSNERTGRQIALVERFTRIG